LAVLFFAGRLLAMDATRCAPFIILTPQPATS